MGPVAWTRRVPVSAVIALIALMVTEKGVTEGKVGSSCAPGDLCVDTVCDRGECKTCTWILEVDKSGQQDQRITVILANSLQKCKAKCSQMYPDCVAIDYNGRGVCQVYNAIPIKYMQKGSEFYEMRNCKNGSEQTTANAGLQDKAVPTTKSTPLVKGTPETEKAPKKFTDPPGTDPACRRCLSTATCSTTTKRCKCPPGTHGDGALECVPHDKMLCTVEGDPHVHTWRKERTSINLPCWYYLTEIENGNCVVNVKAKNELTSDGLYYVSDMEVTLLVHPHFIPPGPVLPMRYKVSEDLVRQAKGGNPWPGAQKENVHGVEVLKTWDSANRFAVLSIPSCNIRAKFRARVLSQSLQVQKPAVTLSMPRDLTFSKTTNHTVCQNPGAGANSYKVFMERNSLLSKALATIYIILSVNNPYSQGMGPSACFDLGEIYRREVDRRKKSAGTNLCGPLVTHRPLVRCLLKKNLTLYRPEKVFRDCLKWVLFEDTDACQRFLRGSDECRLPKTLSEIRCNATQLPTV